MGVPTTFEKELHKIFDGIDSLDNKKYVGRAIYANIDKDVKFKAEIISLNTYQHYDALRIRILRRDEGEVDANTIRFKDAWGIKAGNGPGGVSPHLWISNGKLEWYSYIPTPRDLEILADQVTDYVEIFQDQDMSQEIGGMSM